MLYIIPKSGIIRVKLSGGIDAEVYEYLYYDIIATDGVHETKLPVNIYPK